MKHCAFTLAEVLITLAIIGVVAAIAIPSVISNSQQQEFKTGLRKAVSVLNSAITMNMALDGESPYDNGDLFRFLQRHMNVMSSTTVLTYKYKTLLPDGSTYGGGTNSAFYTTDGMRFEFEESCGSYACGTNKRIHETGEYVHFCIPTAFGTTCKGCGSYGLKNNVDNTTLPPCMILVDINGDRKPSPSNVSCTSAAKECYSTNFYRTTSPESKILNDIFSIIVTDKAAIPYGVAAQKAMYSSQK